MEANPSPCRFFADRSLPREEQQLTALYERYHCFLDDLLVDLESTPPSAMRVEELQRLLGWPTDHCSAHTVRIERFPYRTIPEGTLEAVEGGLTCAEGRVIPISGLLGIPNGTPRNGFLLTIPGTASGPERDFGVETSTYDSADYAHQFAQRAMGEGFIVFSPPECLRTCYLTQSRDTTAAEVRLIVELKFLAHVFTGLSCLHFRRQSMSSKIFLRYRDKKLEHTGSASEEALPSGWEL